VTLSTGEEISARLIVLANGLNISLRHSLGIGREVMSPVTPSASASTLRQPIAPPSTSAR
jgi:2-polyprenyl-6-methoxyphenol hydroxylase-like FAD-dependent oxidoreductase